jgi:hypothetical protein
MPKIGYIVKLNLFLKNPFVINSPKTFVKIFLTQRFISDKKKVFMTSFCTAIQNLRKRHEEVIKASNFSFLMDKNC